MASQKKHRGFEASQGESISVPGLGDVPSPSALGQERNEVLVDFSCPVEGCEATFDEQPTFAQLRGHFGTAVASGPLPERHKDFDLQKEDYQ